MTAIISRSSLLHLRVPFSFFLLPIFLFALALSPNLNPERMLIVFVTLHFLLYPASNGFNSYYDKDEDSIGGLKRPPKVTNDLLYISLLLDLIAIVLAFQISFLYAAMLFIYGVVSKAYSHPATRLKKYPWISWVVAGLFQGAFTFYACYIGINDFPLRPVFQEKIIFGGLLTTALLLANYPMTQIYQHEEDSKRGDKTLSLTLGTRGTFIFTGIIFFISAVLFVLYFNTYLSSEYGWQFLLALTLPIGFFLYWFFTAQQHPEAINHQNTMRLNWISGIALNVFFTYLFLDYSHVLQALKGGF